MLRIPNVNHPFFAYGTFKPGQIAYSRLENCIESENSAYCKHQLFLRDGAPFISEHPKNGALTRGNLIKFKRERSWDAYRIINEIVSDKLYYWEVIDVQGQPANALIGRSPSKSNPVQLINFDGSEDPYFKEAIEIISEGIDEYDEDSNKQHDGPKRLRRYFKLLRNYILLWAAIERYISLRYGKGNDIRANEMFALEPVFQESLRRHVGEETRDIFRTDNLDRITLDANFPEDSIDYYYTIRCNIVHRGKTPPGDEPSKEEIVFKSLKELLSIFKDVLNDTFNES